MGAMESRKKNWSLAQVQPGGGKGKTQVNMKRRLWERQWGGYRQWGGGQERQCWLGGLQRSGSGEALWRRWLLEWTVRGVRILTGSKEATAEAETRLSSKSLCDYSHFGRNWAMSSHKQKVVNLMLASIGDVLRTFTSGWERTQKSVIMLWVLNFVN